MDTSGAWDWAVSRWEFPDGGGFCCAMVAVIDGVGGGGGCYRGGLGLPEGGLPGRGSHWAWARAAWGGEGGA